MFFSVWSTIGFLGLTALTRQVESFSMTPLSLQQQHQHRTATASSTQASPTTTQLSVKKRNRRSSSEEDSADLATPLQLSTLDVQRLTQARTSTLQQRQQEMPILILPQGCLLPKQRLLFESSDRRFCQLVDYCLEHKQPLALLGLNPYTGKPLGRGVTIDFSDLDKEKKNTIVANPMTKTVRLAVTAQEDHLVEVQGEPWLDDKTESFYLADVETIALADDDAQYSSSSMTKQERETAAYLSDTLPAMMDEWQALVIQTGACDPKGLQQRLEEAGGGQDFLPSNLTERAMLVAAMLNPSSSSAAHSNKQHQQQQVCLEIRPAMLACTNDYERTILAVQALQSSIDHLSGKHKLF